MRFCHVTTFYPPWNFGGDGILVQQICEALARRGHQVDVAHCIDAYRAKGGADVPAPEESEGITRHGLRSRAGLLSPLVTQQTGRPGLKYSKLKTLLASDYDVVHFHNISLVGGPGILRLSRAPVTLYTAHDHWLICPTHILWKFRNRPCDGPQCFRCSVVSGIPPQLWRDTTWFDSCLEHVDAVLAPSRFTAAKHRDAGIRRPIFVLNSFSRSAAADQPVARPAEPATFLYAGRLEASKGLNHLLEAFRRRSGYRLLIAGDGSLAGRLASQYADCPHIRFLGRVAHDEMDRLYQGAVAVISPTWGPESFHLVTIEAMACGVPVIGRRAGGSVEAIERTGGGLIYDEPQELLPLMDRVARDPELRHTLSRRAQAGYRLHYSEERWLEQYLDLIGKLAATKATKGAFVEPPAL